MICCPGVNPSTLQGNETACNRKLCKPCSTLIGKPSQKIENIDHCQLGGKISQKIENYANHIQSTWGSHHRKTENVNFRETIKNPNSYHRKVLGRFGEKEVSSKVHAGKQGT